MKMSGLLLGPAALLLASCAGLETLPPPALPDGGLAAEVLAGWTDLRVAFHVHTGESPDGKGTLGDVLSAARDAGIQALVLTEHDHLGSDGRSGTHDGIVVLCGEEVGSGSHVLSLGASEHVQHDLRGRELRNAIHARGGRAVLAHPGLGEEDDRDELLSLCDALEIYSFSTDTLEESRVSLVLKSVLGLPFSPRCTLLSILDPPRTELALWDRELARRPLPGIGAVDSHGTWGLSHRRAFSVVQTHVLVREKTEEAILDALLRGRSHVTFEVLGEVPYFLFAVEKDGEHWLSGESIPWQDGMRASFQIPGNATWRLLRNGRVFCSGEQIGIAPWTQDPLPGPGVYRLEAWREERPWILSNAIRLEKSVPATPLATVD